MNNTYYFGYWNGILMCISNKEKPVRKYLRENRKCTEEAIDIIEVKRPIRENEEPFVLVKYCDRYVTWQEGEIILRDFRNFMDDAWDAQNTLYTLGKCLKKDAIYETSDLCQKIFKDDDMRQKVFEKYFQTHFIVNMNIGTYMAYQRAFPQYMQSVSKFR